MAAQVHVPGEYTLTAEVSAADRPAVRAAGAVLSSPSGWFCVVFYNPATGRYSITKEPGFQPLIATNRQYPSSWWRGHAEEATLATGRSCSWSPATWFPFGRTRRRKAIKAAK